MTCSSWDQDKKTRSCTNHQVADHLEFVDPEIGPQVFYVSIADEDAVDLRRQVHSMHKKLSKAKQEIEELRAEQEQLCKPPMVLILAECALY